MPLSAAPTIPSTRGAPSPGLGPREAPVRRWDYMPGFHRGRAPARSGAPAGSGRVAPTCVLPNPCTPRLLSAHALCHHDHLPLHHIRNAPRTRPQVRGDDRRDRRRQDLCALVALREFPSQLVRHLGFGHVHHSDTHLLRAWEDRGPVFRSSGGRSGGCRPGCSASRWRRHPSRLVETS